MLLFLAFITAGIMAEDPPRIHYSLKNSSVCLCVTNHPPPYEGNGEWIFAGKLIVSRQQVNPKYKEKVNLNNHNLTLCVHELTEADSGIYKVLFRDSEFNQLTDSHRVVVQEAVPRPVIRMSALHSNQSAGLCTIRVNCSIREDWALSLCSKDSCRSCQGSFSKVNISISTDNRTIICSGKNHVSANNISESMEATCFSESYPEHKEASQPPLVIIIVIAVLVILGTFIVCMAKKFFSTENNHHQTQTSNAELIQSQPVETQPQGSLPRPRVSSSSSSQTDAMYENVDDILASQTSNPTISPREELGSKQSQKIDTVYSILQARTVMASVGKSDNSKDSKGYKKMQDTMASQSVSLDEAEHTRQTDTLYSLLQKPNNLSSQCHQQVKQDVEKPKT